jgi:anti-sigma regulatory factor (Ser/Thr protein kinase)
MSCDLSVELPRTPEAPALARRALEDLNGCLDPARLPDVRLLVSELVTNSVKYGGEGPVRLEVSRKDDRSRAEIIDQGAGFTPKARDDDLDRVGGWGLHLVEHLTDRWGTHEGSTHVWFEMNVSPAAGFVRPG